MKNLMNFRIIAFGIALAGSLPSASAQQPVRYPIAEMKLREDSLKLYSRNMVFSEEVADRLRSDSIFVRMLIRALKFPHSYDYPFDSLNISQLRAPDNRFRILTWQLKKDEYVVWQKGAIQMNTPDGSLKLFPLFDYSMYTSSPSDSVRSPRNWIGALYYRMIQKVYQGKNYYTLIGFDEFSVNSNKKWMEVLSFDSQGEPVFGGPFFSFENDSLKKPIQHRYSIEYKKEARAFFNYDSVLDLVILDHLVSETDEPQKKYTLVPDGDYEAFRWHNGKWVHIDKLFHQRLKEGEFPLDARLYDDQGNANEDLLNEVSRKNAEKEKAQTPKKPVKAPEPPKKKN